MPIPNTNSFGTDFTPNHLTEEEAIEVLRQAYQTIAKRKRRNKMKQALQLLFAELNYLREKQLLCRQVREDENKYDEQIELLLKAIEYLEKAIKKGE